MKNGMKTEGFLRYISLAVVLMIFWSALSGHYTGLLIGLGVFSVLGVVYICHRMAVIDEEGHPIHLAPRSLAYWPWLVVEILKSAIGVSRLIVDPGLPVSPALTRVRPGQRTQLGVNIYANSITLTPGTITVEANSGELLVHAITKGGAQDLDDGDMDRRVTRLEGGA